MLYRKEQTKQGITIPTDWCESAEQVLYSAYQKHCDAQQKGFKFYGLTYPNEVYMAISYLDVENELEAPVTYHVSADLKESDKDLKKLLDKLIDSVGIFFDIYFADPNWNEYVVNWTEGTFQGQDFHYKITRENIGLSIQAEYLLNQ
jgi:hypothetical protein